MNTNEEILNLKQSVNKLAKEFGNHSDGDGTNPHMLATELNNGLMSSDTYRQAIGYEIKDNYLDTKYSFWDLPFGKYATVYNGNGGWDNDGLNLPDTMVKGDLIHLHVFGEDNRRKVYIMQVQKNGSLFYLSTSENTGNGGGNNNSKVWKIIPQETILWKGSAGYGESMDLAVSTRRFRLLKITVTGTISGTFLTPAFDNPSIQLNGLADKAEEAYMVKLGFTDMYNQIQLKLTRVRLATFTPDGMTIKGTNDTNFKITEIMGVY